MLLAAGCHSYSPYGYGYQGGYPMNADPAYSQMQPYSQPAGTMGGQPTLAPGATFPSQPRAVAPSPGGRYADAPPYQPSTAQPPGNLQQPNQYLPQGTPAAQPKIVPDPLGDDDDLPQKPVGANQSGGVHLGTITDDSEDNLAQFGEEAFAKPIQVRSASASITHGGPAMRNASARPNPYKHDTGKYTWLRGVVGYDDQEGVWHVQYSDSPQQGDIYGGSLTMVPDGSLDKLIPDDVVYVEGRIDGNQRDRYGKPMYHVTKIERLIPKASVVHSADAAFP